jgi:hypothetical protein
MTPWLKHSHECTHENVNPQKGQRKWLTMEIGKLKSGGNKKNYK